MNETLGDIAKNIEYLEAQREIWINLRSELVPLIKELKKNVDVRDANKPLLEMDERL